jgi:transcriptional regulator with XRE-family HTH domain
MDEKVERIKKIMDEKGLTAASFAANIQVSPATITHILKGRNNVSQNVFDKILDAYPGINPDWLRTGREPMYRHEKHQLHLERYPSQPNLFENLDVTPTGKPDVSEYSPKNEVERPQNATQQTKKQEINPDFIPVKKIDKIIIFYTDNTFQTFSPEK